MHLNPDVLLSTYSLLLIVDGVDHGLHVFLSSLIGCKKSLSMLTTPAHPNGLYGVVPYNDRIECVFMITFSYSAAEAKKGGRWTHCESRLQSYISAVIVLTKMVNVLCCLVNHCPYFFATSYTSRTWVQCTNARAIGLLLLLLLLPSLLLSFALAFTFFLGSSLIEPICLGL